ncbi:16S rRNA (guanine(527)-N(7))-methyltransferase RsmG [Pasteurella skyensis]|uniref:Ribosomal RNA small subunit methyltransferase G n=1 Tax=Phocoenobacter skyensis TaxID=97481 RepID=A0AAJ6P1K7_9PAST|nr:16S rRNA (guanine(527)-N(7))-methyltransferase RsmG [Pasteurella skyensis]MDP8162547.1 16S rRNA (guanine(527)-N(7))-methyltransferase RsmG [Pasteurella skyensis]MDP8173745.1 16S rRNA (guanine(527)-N(7))-methyltransferase RsmG [Pasteurella skyensis]MDP8179912.1 16S rRNA (guanine(527)-N(7))-methyltransferase RsmG [Pasteurella skyensis]MDP8184026.1 16S rRNA (guanine(527)-N(7))-methyltransferase RsmG [Pasteurella skyensis]MDP8190220.1 16S rRNA (guanine(527)-N(7))-methyltransferase RsmG [Pasteur
MNFAKAEALLNELNFEISTDQKEKLFKFVALLDKWNKAYNLTSVRDPNEMWVKHILDSLVVSPHLVGSRFIDVGTGPGLPGIPLAIINPNKEFILLDSLGKRIRFIEQVLLQLGIKNVTPIQSRVEEYQPEQGFDGVISRAFASLNDMVHWCEHLPSETGQFYALKGIYNKDEVAELPDNFGVENVISLDVPELIGERHLLLIKKLT